jgi:hypothetical protein
MWVLISTHIHAITVDTCVLTRKVLKSLQNVAGVYGLVIPCLDVIFPGVLVGHFTGGEPSRAVLPKDMKERGHHNVQDKNSTLLQSSAEGDVGHGVGYGVQLTYVFAGMMLYIRHRLILDVRNFSINIIKTCKKL